MKLSIDQVEHISRLARLELTNEEKERYRAELSAILNYVEILQELQATDVLPTEYITETTVALRRDVVDSVSDGVQRQLVAEFPAQHAGLLAVPSVFEVYKE